MDSEVRDRFQALAVMLNDAMEQGLLRSFTLVATIDTPVGPAIAGLANERDGVSQRERLEHMDAYINHVTAGTSHGKEEQREASPRSARSGSGAVRYRYADSQGATAFDPAASLEGPHLRALSLRGKPN